MKLLTRRIICAVGKGGTGFCICCGREHGGISSLIRRNKCVACGVKAVFSANELLLNYSHLLDKEL